jgi:hypothetical protein
MIVFTTSGTGRTFGMGRAGAGSRNGISTAGGRSATVTRGLAGRGISGASNGSDTRGARVGRHHGHKWGGNFGGVGGNSYTRGGRATGVGSMGGRVILIGGSRGMCGGTSSARIRSRMIFSSITRISRDMPFSPAANLCRRMVDTSNVVCGYVSG